MTVDEALEILEKIVETGRLNKVQRIVFRQAWEGQSYLEIASAYDYDYNYIKETGAELWQVLSTVLGQKVTKFNFQIVLKHYANQESLLASQSAVNRSQLEPGETPQSVNATHLGEQETLWVGREALVNTLTQKIQDNCRVLMLVGITGIGKTSLAVRLSLEPKIAQTWSEVRWFRFTADQYTFDEFACQLLGQMPSTFEFDQNPQKLANDLVTYLQAHPCLLVLDMVEELLTASNRGELRYKDTLFAKFFDRLLEVEIMPSRLILTSQDRPPVMAEGRYKERSHLEQPKGLNMAEALELFEVWQVNPSRNEEVEYLQRIIQVYEGHPLALGVIAGEIRENPYCGDIQAYWQDYGQEIVEIEKHKITANLNSNAEPITLAYFSINLTDLVKYRIERTFSRLQVSSPLAYTLLCMGATYRCSAERTAWLVLIADAPKEEQITAFQALQRRFLLESDRSVNRVLYRLHSLIRSIALQHLNNLESEVAL